jgi:hypothetical protein
MAERKQVEETERMNEPLVAKILLDFLLEALDVRQDVSVRDHNATRLGGRAGSEDDLQRVLTRH